MELVGAEVVYPHRAELEGRMIWRCTNCDAHVGCHRDGAKVFVPGGEVVVSDGTLAMGSLANKDLRAARIETHRMFEMLWQPPARMTRAEAYRWMARLLSLAFEEAHIAALTYDKCVKVQLVIEDLVRPADEAPELPGAAHWLNQAPNRVHRRGGRALPRQSRRLANRLLAGQADLVGPRTTGR